jgi:hypothetical protein
MNDVVGIGGAGTINATQSQIFQVAIPDSLQSFSAPALKLVAGPINIQGNSLATVNL